MVKYKHNVYANIGIYNKNQRKYHFVFKIWVNS